MMFRLNVPTKRGSVLNGVLFRPEEKRSADTVMIAITGIHGNFYSNPFYYNIGDTLNSGIIDFIYAQTNDAFGQIETFNVNTGQKETIGSWNERFSYTDEDIDAYLTFAEEEGYEHIILAGHSLGANKPEEGIPLYCMRLAGIYKSEESIGGLPINMNGFCLFDKDHRSSKPLNLAYKAAQLSDLEKADSFLIALRHATVIDCLPTTHFEIIMRVVRDTGIDEESFIRHYQNGSAEAALNEDLDFASRLGIHSLPAYLIQYKDKALLMQSFEYQDFSDAIKRVMY